MSEGSDQAWKDRALARIGEQGWAKGSGVMPLGGCCLALSVHPEAEWPRIGPALTDAIGLLFPGRIRRPWSGHFYALTQFNDHPDTTLADVEKVIATARLA
jgi:hypothetical protein